MYCRLEADATESEDDASEHGDPKSEMETSRAQCTSFCGMAAIVMVSGVDAELEDVIVVGVFVDVEQIPTRSDHVQDFITRCTREAPVVAQGSIARQRWNAIILIMCITPRMHRTLDLCSTSTCKSNIPMN